MANELIIPLFLCFPASTGGVTSESDMADSSTEPSMSNLVLQVSMAIHAPPSQSILASPAKTLIAGGQSSRHAPTVPAVQQPDKVGDSNGVTTFLH